MMSRRVRTPTVLQMEAVECGAAALGIVLAHHGRWVPLEQLRVDCGISRDGSKASSLVRAARGHGLKAHAFSMSRGALARLTYPVILHWGFNHFVVLEGFGRKRWGGGRPVYLNDPAHGPRRVSEEELDGAFTGVVLTFRPGPDFQPAGHPPRLLPALARRLTRSRAAVAFVLIAALALVVPQLLAPIFPKLFIDEVLLGERGEWLPPLLLAMGLTALLLGALTWLQLRYLLRLGTRLAVSGASDFFIHLLRLPLAFYHQRHAGDLSLRVLINDRVAQLLSRDLAVSFLNAGMAVFFLLLLFQYHVGLTLVGIAVVGVNLLALRLVSRRRADGNRRLLQELGKVHGTGAGGLALIESVKAGGGESALFARLAGYQAKVVNARQQMEVWTQVLEVVPPFLAALTTALILGLGGVEVMAGGLTVGALIAYLALMASFTAPVRRLVGLGAQLQMVEGDMARLDDVLRYPAEPIRLVETVPGLMPGPGADPVPDPEAEAEAGGRAPAPPPPLTLRGRLELRGITFGYNPLAPPLLRDFHLTLEPGRRVALVGHSGSGKSTLVRLITGLYQPWEGEVLFDGLPRSAIPRPVLASCVRYVDQQIFLFPGSVRDNLTLWDRTATQGELEAAARDAAIHREIVERSRGETSGYDSPVLEGGLNWSGGQRQRLEIARALVGEPSLLLLDEATSALDPAVEVEIDEALRRRGLTCLLVAHRLSTVRDADEIIVLSAGEVVERGTHDQLFAAGGAYAELIRLDGGWGEEP